MKKFLIPLLIVPVLTKAQVNPAPVKRTDVGRGIDAVGYTFLAPARWHGKQWLVLSGVVAGTAAITLLDDPVRDFWNGKDTKFLDGVEHVGYHYGKHYTAIGLTGGFYFTGILLKNEWAKETGLMLATGLTTSTIIQTFFKNVAGRARPNTNLDHYEMKPFSSSSDFHAFPSGHTTVAFTISLILARQVESVPLKIVFYSLATVTAMSRLYNDVHWISDVAFGGTVAWACADAAVKRIEANRFRLSATQKNKIHWKLYPYPGGLSLRARL